MPDTMYFEVRVVLAAEPGELEPEDRDVAGAYPYEFPASDAPELAAGKLAEGYAPEDRFMEHVLDMFHGEVPIHTLDHFGIEVVRMPEPGDAPDAPPAGVPGGP